MITNHYVIYHKRGHMSLSVPADLITPTNERRVVATRAWQQLMGKNILDEDVKKQLPTRKILMDELLSRYDDERDQVYTQFVTTIKITLVRIEHGKP